MNFMILEFRGFFGKWQDFSDFFAHFTNILDIAF